MEISDAALEAARQRGRELAGNQPGALVEAMGEIAAEGAKAAFAASQDAPASEPVAWHVYAKGWGDELVFTEDGAKELAERLGSIAGVKKPVIVPLFAAPIAQATEGWRTMDSAPKDGKHCILAVKEGAFIWSVQGAYQFGKWNVVHRDNVDPLYWMPNVPLPAAPTPTAEGEQV